MVDFSDEKFLLDEIRKGNNQAFEYLFKAYYPRLRGYAIRFVEDEETARDIIQECFLRFWEKRELLSAVSVTSLLFAMVRNGNQSMGITVVIITHEMAVIEAVCDRVAIIDKSHIAEIGEVSRVFAEPKSKIGRQLILGDAAEKVEFGTGRLFRIIFDGLASSEPVISNVVLACKVPVNIMYAATRDIKGKAAGQMIIELPDHEPDIERVLQYLDRAKVPYEEVGKNEL